MRVLITGFKGFTAQYLKAELENHQHETFGLSCDLMETNAITAKMKQVKPEAIVHLAAMTFVGHPNPLDFYRVNLLGTYNLLTIVEQNLPNIQSILLVSSANIYGNGIQTILTEESPAMPLNDYAVSKLAMENMAKLWLDRLPIFVVRPFNYTGIGQKDNFLIPKIVSHFKKKAPFIELGNIDVWREFGDVRVVAEIYRRLLELSPVGKTVNVCTGEAYSLREVLTMASDITGHHLEVKVNPAYIRAHEVRMLKGDNHQLKTLIHQWTTRPFKETLAWMLEG
jgi:nucleoside-diphosphate-sugar epimerase